jgi:hypothetical protein
MTTMNPNEMDVRAEIAEPLLAALGYLRGTTANIDREFRLTYERHFLGRKKATDRPLVGIADFRLSVVGYGHWVLDTKAGDAEISRNDIEQVISYARHPEVSGHYAAVLNGRRFVLYRTTQSSTEDALVEIQFSSYLELVDKLKGFLSPSAIKRDCCPPIVDLGQPLADGLRSSAKISGGSVQYKKFDWHANFDVPSHGKVELDEACRRLSSYRVQVTGGRIWRDETSRIRAKLDWSSPEPRIAKFAIDKKLSDIEYINLEGQVSLDRTKPSPFDVVSKINVQQGEQLFDFLRWTSKIAALDCDMILSGRAAGSFDGRFFAGEFQCEIVGRFPAAPNLQVLVRALGEFDVEVDRR